jgi:hypothetical protein
MTRVTTSLETKQYKLQLIPAQLPNNLSNRPDASLGLSVKSKFYNLTLMVYVEYMMF